MEFIMDIFDWWFVDNMDVCERKKREKGISQNVRMPRLWT